MSTVKKPNILITNDDGINAPGIYHLWKLLSPFANVTVIAPQTEQSAIGLAITLRSPLKIEKLSWRDEIVAWSINGTPSDCVKLGLKVVFNEKPDLIVSGINRGCNAGRSALYSGTVAAAIEGVLHGLPAIAFSCYDYWDTEYAMTDAHIPKIVQYVLNNPPPQGTLLNVNFPSRETPGVIGYKMTRQGKSYWIHDPVERLHPGENHSYYWLGLRLAEFEEEEDSDIAWLKKGYVTAVPIHINELTDHGHLQQGRSTFEELHAFDLSQ